MIDPKQLEEELKQFSGSDIRYEYNFMWINLLYTEGCKYLFESAQCYWLINFIAAFQDDILEVDGEFLQVWRLSKCGDTWQLICTDGNNKRLCGEEISYSDFPLESITIWLVGKTTLMLPSEY
jgi:hypothetical protein